VTRWDGRGLQNEKTAEMKFLRSEAAYRENGLNQNEVSFLMEKSTHRRVWMDDSFKISKERERKM
jgi:hypothetical protein